MDRLNLILNQSVEWLPGCEKCALGRIKKPSEFGYTTEMCTCYTEYEAVKEWLNIFSRSNIQKESLSRYSLGNYKGNVISEAMLWDFVQGVGKKKWFYFSGPTGTGKTYSAILCALMAIYLGKQVYYANVPNLMDMLRPSEKDVSRVIMQKCIEAEFLVLDDLGQEKGSEWVLERLYIIVNERYLAQRATIYTSNHKISSLPLKISHKAIVSRLVGDAHEVQFVGEDKRLLT